MKKRPKTKPKQTERTTQSPQTRTSACPRQATTPTKLAKKTTKKRSKENKITKCRAQTRTHIPHQEKGKGKKKEERKGET